ncbi:hypothetical protein ACHAXT_005542 [Thalassiosira profunda]
MSKMVASQSYVLYKAAGAITKALEFYGGLSSEWPADQLDVVSGLVFLVLVLGYTYYCSGPIRQELEPANGNDDVPEAPNEGNGEAEISLRLDVEFYATNRALLISQGFGEAQARQISLAQTFFAREVTRLAGLTEGNRELVETERIAIAAGASDEEGVLLHHDILLPDWKKFVSALSSVAPANKGYIRLSLQQIQIGPEVSDLLLKSLQMAPILDLVLINNGPGAVDFAVRALGALEANPTIHLHMEDSPIVCERDAMSFAKSLPKHPNDGLVALNQCSLGNNNAVMAAIVPALLDCLKVVVLKGNNIGVYGARQISAIIAGNPVNLRSLSLPNNLMGDDAAQLFAESLKTNDRLMLLQLGGNDITKVGAMALTYSLCCPRGLNSLYEDSNHTCMVDLGEDSSLRGVNVFDDPQLNRSMKILGTLVPLGEIYWNMRLFNNVPVEIIPRVLVLLRGERFGNLLIQHNALSAVYRFIREWNMPLLYTNRRCPENRRDERLRKKKVKELMGR